MKTHAEVRRHFVYGLGDADGSSLDCRRNLLSWNGWPLAIRKDFGHGICFLVNGDRMRAGGWGGVNEQSEILREAPHQIQIPFSALAGAKIYNGNRFHLPDLELKVVDIREAKSWNTCAVCGKRVEYVHGLYYHASVSYWGQKEHVNPDMKSPICENWTQHDTLILALVW